MAPRHRCLEVIRQNREAPEPCPFKTWIARFYHFGSRSIVVAVLPRVGVRGGHSEWRRHNQHPPRRKVSDRKDFVAPPNPDRGAPGQEERDIRTKPRGNLSDFSRRNRKVPEFSQPDQRGGCIAAAATQTRSDRNALDDND